MTGDPDIIVITGIMAAGKSTVAQRLAERLPRSVHLRGDLFRRMIVNGRAEITPANWLEAARQIELRHRLACQAALTYANAGFIVMYQDVILGDDLQKVVDLLRTQQHRVAIVVLAPAAAVAAQRDRDRLKTGYGAWTAADIDASLREDTPRLGLWLDTSEWTVDQTVDAIFRRLAEAQVPESRR